MTLPSFDMLTGRVSPLWRAVVAIAILCGLLLALVESRAGILRSGVEVRLRTAPVDPRDLFRGDYVVLSYDISLIDGASVAGDKDFKQGDAIHVRLAPGADGLAVVQGVYKTRPAAAEGSTLLAGRVTATGACALGPNGQADCALGRTRLRVAYGLESYFVPQGSGLAIERTRRERIEVVAAVSAGGEAAIKHLLIDGKLVHSEPPY